MNLKTYFQWKFVFDYIFMVLEQIAISDMVMEPTAQELDYEEYKTGGIKQFQKINTRNK